MKKQIVDAHKALAELAAAACTGKESGDDYVEARIRFLQHQVWHNQIVMCVLHIHVFYDTEQTRESEINQEIIKKELKHSLIIYFCTKLLINFPIVCCGFGLASRDQSDCSICFDNINMCIKSSVLGCWMI